MKMIDLPQKQPHSDARNYQMQSHHFRLKETSSHAITLTSLDIYAVHGYFMGCLFFSCQDCDQCRRYADGRGLLASGHRKYSAVELYAGAATTLAARR
jgi:hypothetical protein